MSQETPDNQMEESVEPVDAPEQETEKADRKPFHLKLSLQVKYTLVFGGIFLTVLYFITTRLFEDEKRDLEALSHQQFTAIFNTITPNAAEALSVGEADKLALKASLEELFQSNIIGLDFFRVVQSNRTVYLLVDSTGSKDDVPKLNEVEMAELDGKSKRPYSAGDLVYLTRKIDYETATKTVFLGYAQLAYSLKPIRELIERKQQETFVTASVAFLISILIVISVTSILIRRIKLLHQATRQLEAGEFPVVEAKGSDELGELIRSFNHMTQAVKERLLMAKYVSGSTIEAIRNQNMDNQALGGIRNESCFFFSDIRGFTAFSEKNDPATVVQYLNELLNMQVEIIHKNGGDIDKFVGDEVMAVFRGEGKEARAVQAGVDIQKKIREMVTKDDVYKEIRIGIGIHSGEVISGNMGSRDRMDYTSIGDTVNTSARLCSAAGGDEVLVSEIAKSTIPDGSFEFSEPFNVPMKNKKEKLNIYRVIYE